MRPLLRFLSCLFVAMPFTAAHLAAADAVQELSLRVMAYNIRYASTQPPNAWPDRRPAMKQLLDREMPDLIGTQEGVYSQVKDLAADLPAYEWIGIGRDGGSRGEFMAVFYKRDRFEPLAFDHFWLSDSPALIGSFTWGNRLPRMVTWVRFRDRESGRVFEFWNTHFDHQSEPARQRSAVLLRERLAKVDPALPIVLVGDFNAIAGSSAAYATLTEGTGLIDTWVAARERRNEGMNTYNNFREGLREDRRIDWIIASSPVTVETAAIVTDADNGVPPSDHYPVTATLRF
jgi:endonuclease/exonuclease/phosphatase family metal-dependent hydrolase